jgi:hypothetical protein
MISVTPLFESLLVAAGCCRLSAAALMTSRNRTTLDDKNVSRRWRKQLCPYCNQPFLGRGGAVIYCSSRCAATARYKRRVTG